MATTKTIGTRTVGALTALRGVVDRLGGRLEPIVSAAGLRPDVFDDPTNRIEYQELARLLQIAAVQLNCPHIGLLIGREWHLTDMGLAGEMALNSPTVGRALYEFAHHHHLNSDGTVAFMLQFDEFAEFGVAFYSRLPEAVRIIQDAFVAAAVNVLQDLWGTSRLPVGIRLAHSGEPDPRQYRSFFRLPVSFNEPYSSVRFPGQWLKLHVKNASRKRVLELQSSIPVNDERSVIATVQRTLRSQILLGKASGADVAKTLNMNRRTLDRRLSKAGTGFQEVLDDVRYLIARELLGLTQLPVSEIAENLGYSESAPFIRAFQRWSGTTPGTWRETNSASI